MLNWRSYAPRWIQGEIAGMFLDIIHKQVQTSTDRLAAAATCLFPSLAPEDALSYLAMDRRMPTFTSEDPDELRKRLGEWNVLLDEAGTTDLMARIAHLYHLNSGGVFAIARSGYASLSNAPYTQPSRNIISWDWDSLFYPNGIPEERCCDTWIVILPSHAPYVTFTGGLVGEPTELVGEGQMVGFDAPTPADFFSALRYALASYSRAQTTIHTIIYAGNASDFNPYMPATMPDGTWALWSQRPTRHRYLVHNN